MQLNSTFEPIEWQDSMATGITAIDRQHRYLVDTLQRANAKLLCEEGSELLCEITKDLLRYAIKHFETEEALMLRYDYEGMCPEEARTHVAQHRDFSRQVVTVCDRLREHREISRVEVLTFLNHWLRDHVCGIDQLLGEFLVREMAKPGGVSER